MKSNGGWKKYRTNLYARVSGKMVNPESCNEYTVFADKSKRAKKVKTARVGPLCQTKSGLIKSFHSGAGVSHQKTLTW